MKIKYLGHASFLVTSAEGIKTITDPFKNSKDLTYHEIQESADIVTVSHSHSDHNNAAAVGGSPRIIREATAGRIKGVGITGVQCYHDNAQGAMRGSNIAFCLDVDGIRVCHLGDLGHRLSRQQVAELGATDILFIPVGGHFTIDAKVATEVGEQLRPRVIIPMHWNYKWSLPQIASVEPFLAGKNNVERLNASEIEFTAGELPEPTRIIVLTPAL